MLGSNKLAGNEQFRLRLLDQWLFFTHILVLSWEWETKTLMRMADHPVELRTTKRRMPLRIQKSLAETVRRWKSRPTAASKEPGQQIIFTWSILAVFVKVDDLVTCDYFRGGSEGDDCWQKKNRGMDRWWLTIIRKKELHRGTRILDKLLTQLD